MATRSRKIVLKAAGLYFAAIFGAGLMLGTLRVLWLVPQVGSRAAELIEMPFMLAVMLVAARWIVRRLAVPPRPIARLTMGGLALLLLLATEFGVVLSLRGMSLTEYWGGLDPVSGSVYYALLGLYALLPLLMQNARWYSRHATAWGTAALVALVFGLGYSGYVADLEQAHRRIAGGSQMAQTACGPIEYAEYGTGPAVLLVHGAGGGFDQVAEVGAEFASLGFRVITMSRFGYLRTPLPPNASPQAQADAHACLLDALGIEQAAIAGVSARTFVDAVCTASSGSDTGPDPARAARLFAKHRNATPAFRREALHARARGQVRCPILAGVAHRARLDRQDDPRNAARSTRGGKRGRAAASRADDGEHPAAQRAPGGAPERRGHRAIPRPI
jgi:MFS family permease